MYVLLALVGGRGPLAHATFVHSLLLRSVAASGNFQMSPPPTWAYQMEESDGT